MNIKQLFAGLFAISVLAISACKTSPKEMLTRKWRATDINGPKVSAEQKKMLVDGQSTIEFKKDGSYAAGSKGREDDQGTYTLSEDGKTLTTRASKNKREEAITIKELSIDKFVGEMQGTTITFEPSK